MKTNRKFLLLLPVFLILCSCARVRQQIVYEKPVATKVDLSSVRVEDSTLMVIAKQEDLRNRVGSTSFFVARDKIATNIHVIASADPGIAHVRVKGTTWSIRGITAYDMENDLVILEISGEGIPLPLGDSDAVQNGEAISVVGYPKGRYAVTKGTISHARKSDKRLQMNIKLSSGNSGSPVINSKGQVVGIASAGEKSFSYAIPSNALKTLLNQSGTTEPLARWCERGPIRAFGYATQGRKMLFNNRYEEAITHYDKSIKLNPDDAVTYYNRGLARFKLGDHQAAQGHIEEARGLYETGIADTSQALKLNPRDATAYINRGLARFKLGDHQAAQGHIEEARGLYETGIADTSQALKLNPENPIVYYNRAFGHLLLGESKDAQEDIADAQQHYQNSIADNTQAIKRNPEFTEAYNNRGYAKYLLGKFEADIGNTAEARKLYEAAILDIDESIRQDSDNADAHNTRGIIKATLGDLEGAIADFDNAIKINPGSAEGYYERGRAKEALGYKKEAEMDLKKAKELNPDVGK